jgi:aminoglycoside phosphotransferase family enzyme
MRQHLLPFDCDLQFEILQRELLATAEKAVYERLRREELVYLARILAALYETNPKLDATLIRMIGKVDAIGRAWQETHAKIDSVLEAYHTECTVTKLRDAVDRLLEQQGDDADWWKRGSPEDHEDE